MSRPYYRFPIKYGQVPPLQPAAMRRDMPTETWRMLWTRVRESVQSRSKSGLYCMVAIHASVVVIILLLHGVKFHGDDEVMLFVVSVFLWTLVPCMPIIYIEYGNVVDQIHRVCWDMKDELEICGYALEVITTRFTADDAVANWESDPIGTRLTLCIFPLGRSSSTDDHLPPLQRYEAFSVYHSVEIHRQVPFFCCSSLNSISPSHLVSDVARCSMSTPPNGFEVLHQSWTDFSNAFCRVHQDYHVARRCFEFARCAFLGAGVLLTVFLTLITFIDYHADNCALSTFADWAGPICFWWFSFPGVCCRTSFVPLLILPNQTSLYTASAPRGAMQQTRAGRGIH
jgi:hypothetical protein